MLENVLSIIQYIRKYVTLPSGAEFITTGIRYKNLDLLCVEDKLQIADRELESIVYKNDIFNETVTNIQRLEYMHKVDELVKGVRYIGTDLDLLVYTDGCTMINDNMSSWAAIYLLPQTNEKPIIKVFLNSKKSESSSRMELAAAVSIYEDIANIDNRMNIEIVTDCTYVSVGLNEHLYKWKDNDWKNSLGETITDLDLWEIAYKMVKKHNVTAVHVAGHTGDYYNEIVHTLARRAVMKG